MGFGLGESLALALEVTLPHHLPWASVSPCVPEGRELDPFRSALEPLLLCTQDWDPCARAGPPPALCRQLQGLRSPGPTLHPRGEHTEAQGGQDWSTVTR